MALLKPKWFREVEERLTPLIEERMSQDNFSVTDLADPHYNEAPGYSYLSAYRLCDNIIRKWRRKGWIEPERRGKKSYWQLTPKYYLDKSHASSILP